LKNPEKKKIASLIKSAHSIRMISEGLFDSEDWSNDAENSVLPSQK